VKFFGHVKTVGVGDKLNLSKLEKHTNWMQRHVASADLSIGRAKSKARKLIQRREKFLPLDCSGGFLLRDVL